MDVISNLGPLPASHHSWAGFQLPWAEGNCCQDSQGMEVFDSYWKSQQLQDFSLRAQTWGGFGNTSAFPQDFTPRSSLAYPRTSNPFKSLENQRKEEKGLLLPLKVAPSKGTRGNLTRSHFQLKSQLLPLIPIPVPRPPGPSLLSQQMETGRLGQN